MKRILIVIGNMNIGGIQKSLLELLKSLSKRKDVSVSLFCCNKCGDFLPSVPKEIEVLPGNSWAEISELPVDKCKRLGNKYYLFRIACSLWTKFFNKKLPAALLCHRIKNIGEYDVAISYSQPINSKFFCNVTNEIVLNCTKADRKITFVHCDFENYGGNAKINRELYRKFDTVAVVSDSVGMNLAKCIPEIKDKIKTVYNFCDADEIKTLSNQNPVEYPTKTLVTVARLSEEKGIIRCIPVMAKLKKQKMNFEWHIVGGGGLEDLIRNTIADYGMENIIFLDGQQTNPYRYMKNADYLFLPSFHEAAPMVFNEAIVLNLPILTTNTLSAKELVSDRNAGVVCENTDDGIYHMLYSALTAKKKYFENVNLDMRLNMAQFDALYKLEE